MYSTEGTFAHQGEALLARRPAQRGRVGVFGVAHGVYFRQFDGLREKLQGYYEEFLGLVGQEGGGGVGLWHGGFGGKWPGGP